MTGSRDPRDMRRGTRPMFLLKRTRPVGGDRPWVDFLCWGPGLGERKGLGAGGIKRGMN